MATLPKHDVTKSSVIQDLETLRRQWVECVDAAKALRALTEGVAATIRGVVVGKDATLVYTGGPRPVEVARKVLAPQWECLR